MEWRRLLVAAAVAIAAVAAVPADPIRPEEGHVSNICDPKSVCKCSPNTITCVCLKDMQNLVVKEDTVPGSNLQTLTKFEVRDCSSLSLFEQAFTAAPQLSVLHISNVQNVSLSAGVFANLQSLLVDSVSSLVLHKGALVGIHGLNNIVLMKTYIPSLVEGVLYNINNLQEFKLKEVNITKIEKEAVLIDLKKMASKAEILQSKIGSIETKGLQIGNGTYITVEDTEIMNAEPNSIRIGALETISIQRNVFQNGVDVSAARILYKKNIEFSKNTLLNVDISEAVHLNPKPENETIFTVDRLVVSHGGNKVICKCIDTPLNASEPLKQNFCVHGCTESTVGAFLQSCQKNNALSVADRLKDICKNTADKTTARPQTPTQTPKPKSPTTQPQKNSSGKTTICVVAFIAFCLFHAIL